MGLPWASLLGFLRSITNPLIFERPRSLTDAWGQVKSWLDCDPAWIPGPTEKHRQVLEPLLAMIGSRSNLVPDAHLAALALEHGLILCSTDGDFARFQTLRWEDPLR